MLQSGQRDYATTATLIIAFTFKISRSSNTVMRWHGSANTGGSNKALTRARAPATSGEKLEKGQADRHRHHH